MDDRSCGADNGLRVTYFRPPDAFYTYQHAGDLDSTEVGGQVAHYDPLNYLSNVVKGKTATVLSSGLPQEWAVHDSESTTPKSAAESTASKPTAKPTATAPTAESSAPESTAEPASTKPTGTQL